MTSPPPVDPALPPLPRLLVDSTSRVTVARTSVDVEYRCTGVEPADPEQVDEQHLHAVDLGVQQLGRPRDGGAGYGPASRGWGRWPSGSWWRVRSAWDTSETKCCWEARDVRELTDLLDARGHLVERLREDGEAILPTHPHPLAEHPGRGDQYFFR